jgi:hypothetical protein
MLAELAELGEHGAGAILDLPVEHIPQRLLRYQLFQVRHQRPLTQHSFPDHLRFGRPAILDSDVVRWALGQSSQDPGRTSFLALRAQGVGFVALHRPWLQGAHYTRFRTVIEDALGKPRWETRSWACWSLPPQTDR